MDEALRGEAVLHLPRASNNTGHESLRLARRVKFFNLLIQQLGKTNRTLSDLALSTFNIGTSFHLGRLLKGFHAMFGLSRLMHAIGSHFDKLKGKWRRGGNGWRMHAQAAGSGDINGTAMQN